MTGSRVRFCPRQTARDPGPAAAGASPPSSKGVRWQMTLIYFVQTSICIHIRTLYSRVHTELPLLPDSPPSCRRAWQVRGPMFVSSVGLFFLTCDPARGLAADCSPGAAPAVSPSCQQLESDHTHRGCLLPSASCSRIAHLSQASGLG